MNTYFLIAITVFLASEPAEPEKHEWRGTDRTGVYMESGLLKSWPAEGPSELWSISNIGNGFASPVFTEKNFYITGERDSMSVLYCFDLSGKKIWQTTLGKEWVKTTRGARSCPTVTDKHIYIGTGLGDLYCTDRETGKIIWKKDMTRDFGGVLPLHGHSEAPLISEDKVFWTPGGKEHNVVALNRFTGKLLWSHSGFGERSGYNSPNLIELPGRKILVTFSAYHLMGFDTETGKLLWSQEQDTYPPDKRIPGNGDTHANTVLFDNGSVYYAEGDGNCGVKLKLSDDGSSISEVWRNRGFDGYMGGIVKIGDYIYGCSTQSPEIRSVNATTGMLADSLKAGSGAVIAADKMLYYYNYKGEMMLLAINDGKISKVSSFKITKGTNQHFSHPVIHKGVLYLRHGDVLIAYDIMNKKAVSAV